jgi:hypothetical protein
VIARSGKRAGRGSKISRESLIVSAEKKRDKAYGYAYGYAYGWDYGHEYGDPDWGHVTGTMSTPEARAEASVARPKDVDSPSRQAEVAVAEKTPAKEEKPIKEEKPAEPVPAPSAPSAPAASPLVPVQPLPPPPRAADRADAAEAAVAEGNRSPSERGGSDGKDERNADACGFVHVPL